MPKINANDIPSYYGHTGIVENARERLFEVDPTRTLDGEKSDGLTEEEVGQAEEERAPGLDGPISPVDPERDDKEKSGEKDDSEKVDHLQPAGEPVGNKEQGAPAKPTTASRTAAKK